MQHDRLAVRRRLHQPHVARDDDLEQALGKELFDLVGDLFGDDGAAVVHGQHHAVYVQHGVEVLFDQGDGVHQLRQPFQGVIFALDGDDDRICRGERVDGQKPQRGRAVDEDIVVLVFDLGKGCLQHLFAVLFIDELYFRACQVDIGREQVQPRHLGMHDVFGGLFFVDDDAVHRLFQRAFGKPHARGGVALRVDVDQQHLFARLGDVRRHVDAGGRLADAALLVGKRNDFSHAALSFFRYSFACACFCRQLFRQRGGPAARRFPHGERRAALQARMPARPRLVRVSVPPTRGVFCLVLTDRLSAFFLSSILY